MTTPLRGSEIVLSGIKPSGVPHLGNYLGMIRPILELAARQPALVFIADGHAMTTVVDRAELSARTYELAAALLALGLDPARSVLYRQSDVPEVFELSWILACNTWKGILNRAHAYKSAKDANERAGRPPDHGVSAGLYTYPVLMAADILVVGATLVPVGRDQAQHLEIARELSVAFNQQFGPVLRIPSAVIDPDAATIAGTDGRKMSKSYDNVIPIFASPDELRRRIRRVVTDSRSPEEPKDPESCPLFALYRQLASAQATEVMATRYRAGDVGYGEMKDAVAGLIEGRFGGARAHHTELLADRRTLNTILASGAARARRRAKTVMAAVRAACGLRS